MSEGELVGAYLEGQISRRTLVRRLVAAGVSLGAAVSYAHLLGAERAGARQLGDQHFLELQGKIINQDLDTVIAEERVKVRYSVPARARLEFRIVLHRPSHTYPYSEIGYKGLQTDGPVTRKLVNVPLTANPPHSVDALEPLTTATLELTVVARRGRDPSRGYAGHTRTLER